jgi:peptidylprolyl isomerase
VKDDVVDCRGAGARVGDTVEVRYRLVLWGGSTKRVDDSWARRPTTASFALERGSLIEGWIEGIPGMTVGSRRLLVVPPSQGYGRQGTSGVPPNSTLVFVVDLVRITR